MAAATKLFEGFPLSAEGGLWYESPSTIARLMIMRCPRSASSAPHATVLLGSEF